MQIVIECQHRPSTYLPAYNHLVRLSHDIMGNKIFIAPA